MIMNQSPQIIYLHFLNIYMLPIPNMTLPSPCLLQWFWDVTLSQVLFLMILIVMQHSAQYNAALYFIWKRVLRWVMSFQKNQCHSDVNTVSCLYLHIDWPGQRDKVIFPLWMESLQWRKRGSRGRSCTVWLTWRLRQDKMDLLAEATAMRCQDKWKGKIKGCVECVDNLEMA